MNETKPTFTLHLEDCSALVLSQQQARCVSQHGGQDSEPLSEGPLHLIWLLLSGRQGVPRLRVMFLCNALDGDQVVIDSPYIKGHIAHPHPGRRQPWLWPYSVQLFRPGEVRAQWQVKRRSGWRTIAEQRLLLEVWLAIRD